MVLSGASRSIGGVIIAVTLIEGFERYGLISTVEYNRSHKPRLTHGCLFASGHHGPTVDTFERERCSLVAVLSVV